MVLTIRIGAKVCVALFVCTVDKVEVEMDEENVVDMVNLVNVVNYLKSGERNCSVN